MADDDTPPINAIPKLTWNDPPEKIASALLAAHPDLDPWALGLEEVADLIVALAGFEHVAAHCDEGRCYAAQCRWSDAIEARAGHPR